MGIGVREVDFLIVGCTEIDRSVEFYGTTLGLQRGKQWGEMPAHEFETGNVTIALMQTDAFGQDFVPSASPIAFQVDDVAAATSELESKGVEFPMDAIDSGVCNMAFFADPDGNALMLHHRYAPKES